MSSIVWQHQLETKPERRPCDTKVALDAIRGLACANPAKARVLTYIGQVVASGHAQWDLLDNGDIELCFNTGEKFLLAEAAITRLA